MGDFFGFTFNGYHSSDLGIVRVSDGDRYKEDILPDFDDSTVDIPGGDGTYYFGSYYKSKKFTINIAFDSLSEEQYRNLGRIFSTRKPSLLVFDERPYKGYYVKVEGAPSIEAVCFDEGDTVYTEDGHTGYIPGSIDHKTGRTENIRRVYKGEGELNFVAYDPFAYVISKDLDSYKEYPEHQNNYGENPNELGLYVSTGENTFVLTEDTQAQEGITYYKKIGENSYSVYEIKRPENPKELGLYVLENDIYVLSNDTTLQAGTTYYDDDISNTNEWAAASGLKTKAELADYDNIVYVVVIEQENNQAINVYNPGDMPTPVQIYVPFSGSTIPAFQIILEEKTGTNAYTPVDNATLKLKAVTQLTEDATGKPIASDNRDEGILINTKNHLIEGVRTKTEEVDGETIVSYVTTGTLYNDCVEGGIFFKISARELGSFDGRIRFSAGLTTTPAIIYDYIYF